jgi:hypothetical protein
MYLRRARIEEAGEAGDAPVREENEVFDQGR